VTFLFTDIEGSTRLLQAVGPIYAAALEDHRRLIRAAADANEGRDFGSEGDALFLVFTSAKAAVTAAADAQRALAAHEWPDGVALRVRMGVHTGEATRVGDNYVGLDLHRVARITSAGHGGQVLVSGAARSIVADTLPPGLTLRDLGERRLRDLTRPEHLYQLEVDGLPSEFPALRTVDPAPNTLPTQVTSFVGRRQPVADVSRALETSRLVTLTGPGGTGKTRLSLQVASEIADRFPDGTYFVPLDAITDPALVGQAILTALDIQDARPLAAVERLADHLRSRTALLVLDNFEQVMGAAPLVAELLGASPGTHFIVTSRAALHVYGEQEYPVPPLQLPALDGGPIDPSAVTQYESVALFIERAVAVRPDFAVTNANAPAVAEICARLDGLPLAIELAAARVKILPPEAILARLGSRLGLLAGGARNLPARQQTLRGAIAWSHELLDDPSRQLLARSAIFVGGFGLDEAEVVCGPATEIGMDVFDGLVALVDQSLLRQVEASGEPRFAMLQTIREFALEQLDASGQRDDITRRHAHAYLAVAEASGSHLMGRDSRRVLDVLAREHDNLRAAITWATGVGEAELAVRLGSVLWRYWQMRGFLREAGDRLARVLEMPSLGPRTDLRRQALDAAAGVAYWTADLDRAKMLYRESLDLAREADDPKALGEALYNLSFVYDVDKSDVPQGRRLIEEALAIFRTLDDPGWLARTLWALGNAVYFQGSYDTARDLLAESISIFRTTGDQFGLGWSLHTLGLVDLRLGDLVSTRASWTEMLEIFVASDDVSGIGTGLSNFRSLAAATGDDLRALRLGGASAAVVSRTGADLTNVIEEIEGRTADEHAHIDRASAEVAWAEGQAMTIADAIAYALSIGATPDEHPPDARPVTGARPPSGSTDPPAVGT